MHLFLRVSLNIWQANRVSGYPQEKYKEIKLNRFEREELKNSWLIDKSDCS